MHLRLALTSMMAAGLAGALACGDAGGSGGPAADGAADAAMPGSDAGAGDASSPGSAVRAAAAGESHTCALFDDGGVRCWGWGAHGQLGYGNLDDIGDDETPASVGDVDVGGAAIQLAAGSLHTCALLEGGAVRCWGCSYGAFAGSLECAGDDEAPAATGDAEIGGAVVQLVAGNNHSCALLDGGAVRCWGVGRSGALGYGDVEDVGDDETPASMGDVEVGGPVVHLAAGHSHTCAILEGGAVRCWGYNYAGQLGYGNTDPVGDDETPASAGDVELGGVAVQLVAGREFSCALLEGGAVRCWGYNTSGQLGHGTTASIGDDETPASAGDIDLGGVATQLAAGDFHVCALLDDGSVRCWGDTRNGQIGHGVENDVASGVNNNVGDDETPASVGPVDIGGAVTHLAAGQRHTCAVMETGSLRCWGLGEDGQLGYGTTDDIGDDETPESAGDVPL